MSQSPESRDGVSRVTYLSDFNLDRSVVLGGDKSVSGGTFPGDVDVHNISFVVLHLYYFERILAIK